MLRDHKVPRGPVGRAFAEVFPKNWAADRWLRWDCHIIDAPPMRTSLPAEALAHGRRQMLSYLLQAVLEDDGAEVRDRIVALIQMCDPTTTPDEQER